MKKLFAQIVKFGIVGFISFGIDYVTGLIVLNLVMALTSSSYFEMEIGRASCREECRSRWSPYH